MYCMPTLTHTLAQMNVVRNKQASKQAKQCMPFALSYNTYIIQTRIRAMKGCIIEIHGITNRDEDDE